MRIKSKTVMDQMNAEKPDDVLADLEAKHGCAAPSGSASAVAQLVKTVTALVTEVRQMRDGLRVKSRHTLPSTGDTLHWDGYTPTDPALDENALLADGWTKLLTPVEKALDAVKTPNDKLTHGATP